MPNDYANMITSGTGVKRYKTAQSTPPEDIAEVPSVDDMEEGAEEGDMESKVRAMVSTMPLEELQMFCDLAQERLNQDNEGLDTTEEI